MPVHVVNRTADLLNDHGKAVRGSRVLLLGVTYKPDTSDQRESPALAVAESLRQRGAELVYFDPRVENWTVGGVSVERTDDCLAAVHVYFPDPWWKKRHHKRRVLTPAFLADVARTLAPGGRLHFWTDAEEYYRATLDLLAVEPRLAGPLDVPETPPEHDLDYRTHFERRTRLHGAPVYRSEFRKRDPGEGTPAAAGPPEDLAR